MMIGNPAKKQQPSVNFPVIIFNDVWKKLEMDQETSEFCCKAKDSSVAPSSSLDGSKLQLLVHSPAAGFDKKTRNFF